MDAIAFLQSWYRAQCNGEWEHQYGVTIESLDNPGWQVTIDLVATALADRPMPETRAEVSPVDWLVCQVDHNQFLGGGDHTKLLAILEVFQNWAGAKVE
jgi:hypothetical protein